jgi:hypothetical protein
MDNEDNSTDGFSVCTDMEEAEEGEEVQGEGVSAVQKGSKKVLRRQTEREKLEQFQEAVDRISYRAGWAHCIVLSILASFIIFIVVKFGIKEPGDMEPGDMEILDGEGVYPIATLF